MSDTQRTDGPGDARPTLSRADVAHLAQLARLAVTDQELDRYAQQLDVILTSVAAVSEVAADDIEPTSHAVPLVNVFRQDVPRPGLTREQALAMAPAAEDGRFRVPQILGEEQ
ncbi:MAG TPA: Asp-tRNA(Asn)/Glu-tRNA(Gln) amidotransferase subunit GatC [Nakamurella sp.]|nr:Asp-tRNA(Asn)/Glu-tRNA(Gln) amidotransferase subunit GatC [Nakamurella sp.]